MAKRKPLDDMPSSFDRDDAPSSFDKKKKGGNPLDDIPSSFDRDDAGGTSPAPRKQGVMEIAAKAQGGHQSTTVAMNKEAGDPEQAKAFGKETLIKGARKIPRVIGGLATGTGDPIGVFSGEGSGVGLDAMFSVFDEDPTVSAFYENAQAEAEVDGFKFVTPPNRSGGVITPFPWISKEQTEKMQKDPSFQRASKQVYWTARGLVGPMERMAMGTVSSAYEYGQRKEELLQKVKNPTLRKGIRDLSDIAVQATGLSNMGGKAVAGLPEKDKLAALNNMVETLDPYKNGLVTPWEMEQKAKRQLSAEDRGRNSSRH